MYLDWKYLGIRMELEWKSISTMEIRLKEVALTSHHRTASETVQRHTQTGEYRHRKIK